MNQKDIRDSFGKISLDENSKERILQNLKNKSHEARTQVILPEKKQGESKRIFWKWNRICLTAGGVVCAGLIIFIFANGNFRNRYMSDSNQEMAQMNEENELEVGVAEPGNPRRQQIQDKELAEEKMDRADGFKDLEAASPGKALEEEEKDSNAQGGEASEEEAVKTLIYEDRTYKMIENPWKNGIYLAKPEQKNIGEYLGVLSETQNSEYDGCEIYEYLGFSKEEIICILDKNDEYILFGIRE